MVDVTATAWEPLFRKAASERFQEEKEELVKILKKEGKASKQATPYHKFLESGIAYLLVSKDGWRQEFLPLFEGLLGAQMDNVLAAYGIAWDIQRPEVQHWIDNYTIKFSASIGNTSEEAIRGIIAQAQAEGWPVTKTREAIMETWDGFSKTRADMIARTETMRSSNYGTREAWKEAGVERVSWYTHMDGRQCGWCEEMHGKTISVTEGYATLGQELRDAEGKTMTVSYSDVECPPLHVFCRCIELAVVE
jgi:SPP1 gp7 family putative phage head morphogenesis protein